MNKMKRITAILLAMMMLVALFAACQNTPAATDNPTAAPVATPSANSPAPGESSAAPVETEAPANTGVLTTGDIIAPPEGAQFADSINVVTELAVALLDPLSSASTFTACAVQFNMIFDRLVYRTWDGQYMPELAASWESDDMQHWTFHLRDDVTFHNGDKFTAEDVVNTVALSRTDEAKGSNAVDVWRLVETITAVDEYTVEIVLSQPDSGFIYGITMPFGAIVSKAAREADPITGVWVGTGAFSVSEFVSSDHSVLSRNDDYWGKVPLTKQVRFSSVPEVAARTVMQLNGEADMNLAISPADLDMFVENADHIVYGYAANSTHSLTFSMLDPITSDPNFRLAVAHALNRDEIAQAAGGNWNKVNHDGALWGDSTPYRNTELPEREYDLALSKQYLDASVYNGEEIELLCGPDTLTLSGQMMQEQLRAAGINIRVNSTDVASLMGRGQYGNESIQLIHFVSSFSLNPLGVRRILYPNGAVNRGTYNNSEVNELIDKVATVGDPAEQEIIYKRIQEIAWEELPQISLYERIQTVVTHNSLGGIIINPDMYHDFRGIFKVVD